MDSSLYRLARSIGDLQDIVRAVKAKGASLKATEQPIDTGTGEEAWAHDRNGHSVITQGAQ